MVLNKPRNHLQGVLEVLEVAGGQIDSTDSTPEDMAP